jgi:hypothetical protein
MLHHWVHVQKKAVDGTTFVIIFSKLTESQPVDEIASLTK